MSKDEIDIAKTMKEIKAIEDKYGFYVFGMGLTVLVNTGISNFDDDSVQKNIEDIKTEAEASKDNSFFMTPEFKYGILCCAGELARFSPWQLFIYIKKHFEFDTSF